MYNVENVTNGNIKQHTDTMHYIEVVSEKIPKKILCKDIMYIEIFRNTVYIHTEEDTIRSRVSLPRLIKQLEGGGFLRSFRSYIINMNYIDFADNGNFVLNSGVKIPINKRHHSKIKQKFKEYRFNTIKQ